MTHITLEKKMQVILPLKRGFDKLDDHVIITDPKGNILYANKAVEKKTGFPLRQVLGKKPGDLWGGNMPKSFYKKMWHTIVVEKKPFVGEVKNKKKDGTFYWQELRISPVKNRSGKIQCFIGVEPDITERKKEKESQQNLMSIIGHRILSPVTVIRWSLDWLLRGKNLKRDQRKKLKIMYKESKGLVRMMDDLMFLAHFGKGHPQNENIDMHKEIQNIIAIVKNQYPKVHFMFDDHIEHSVINTNKLLFNELLSNVILNAAEYSNKAGGMVRIVLKSKHASIVWECHDNGIGIPQHDQKNIFQKFFRAKNAYIMKETGSGLGLFIAKMIADNLNWNITLTSREHKGTHVAVTIPENIVHV